MANVKRKTLTYLRASFGKQGQKDTLEQILIQAQHARPHVHDRQFRLASGEVVEGTRSHSSRSGFQLQLTVISPDEAAPVVKRVQNTAAEGQVGSAKPPRDADFMLREMICVIEGNDVVLCSTHARPSLLDSYVTALADAARIQAKTFALMPVIDQAALKTMKAEGVKEIHLNASLYQASEDYASRKSAKSTILNGLVRNIQALTMKDQKGSLVGREDDLTAAVVIRTNRWRSGATAAKSLQDLAQQVIVEEDGEYVVITNKGTRLRASKIVLKHDVNLPVVDGAIVVDSAWTSLKTYLKSLRASGLLDQ